MSKIFDLRKGVDFGAACNKLVKALNLAEEKAKGGTPENYAEAYGCLSASVAIHLIQCTDAGGWDELKYKNEEKPDDLPNELFTGHTPINNPSNLYP